MSEVKISLSIGQAEWLDQLLQQEFKTNKFRPHEPLHPNVLAVGALVQNAIAKGATDTEKAEEGSSWGWQRTLHSSVWSDPAAQLIVVSHGLRSESWCWTARGWREPDESNGADHQGWVGASTREEAEEAAMKWYVLQLMIGIRPGELEAIR